LEPPEENETDVIIVDVSRSVEEIERDALAKIRQVVDESSVQDS